jgi:hypothetical protein
MQTAKPISTMVTFLAGLLVAMPAAHADLPLTVEDLITDKGKFKLDLSVAYANSERRGVAAGAPVSIQTGPASFVDVPSVVGESQGNSDTTVFTLGLRYGLTSKAEIYTRLSSLHSVQRSSNDLGQQARQTESGFGDAWAGVNVELKKDTDTPAVLAFGEVALREKHRHSSASFKSAMLGMTTYKAIDPVVFSLTGACRVNQARTDGAQRLKPGNLLMLNPSVAFAVNDRVTLTTGMQWTHRQADKRDGLALGTTRTATDLLLGVGYGINKGNTVNTTLKVNASGAGGAEMRVSWLYTL